MTAVEHLQQEALRAGGARCQRCSMGWYLFEEQNRLFRCAICGHLHFWASLLLDEERFREYQSRLKRGLRFYIKGQTPPDMVVKRVRMG